MTLTHSEPLTGMSVLPRQLFQVWVSLLRQWPLAFLLLAMLRERVMVKERGKVTARGKVMA